MNEFSHHPNLYFTGFQPKLRFDCTKYMAFKDVDVSIIEFHIILLAEYHLYACYLITNSRTYNVCYVVEVNFKLCLLNLDLIGRVPVEFDVVSFDNN